MPNVFSVVVKDTNTGQKAVFLSVISNCCVFVCLASFSKDENVSNGLTDFTLTVGSCAKSVGVSVPSLSVGMCQVNRCERAKPDSVNVPSLMVCMCQA